MDLSWIEKQARLLIEVPLQPVQGTRFQPTGFPDLGAASYTGPKNNQVVLVESAQSMANRLELTIWDSATADLVEDAAGLPYVVATVNGHRTTSILESHRVNSGHFPDSLRAQIGAGCGYSKDKPVNVREFAKELLRIDPNSLLHGVFLSQYEDGRLRLPRMLSSFIEASDAQLVVSGGVKLDHVSPKGDAAKGTGHIPFSRVEYSAKEITAFFSVDLSQLRSYGLSKDANELLVVLALYKIRRLLDSNLRLRTACDLEPIDPNIRARRPDMGLPTAEALGPELRRCIKACHSLFANPSITAVK